MRNKPPKKVDPDSDIISGLKARDESALALLMDRHLKTISSIGYYMLGDMGHAEDVAQSTFLKTWVMAPKWKTGNATLLTWMRRVATNDCLDRLRKKTPIFCSDSLFNQIDETDSALKELADDDTARVIQCALNSLPNMQRAAITLCYYQEVSQKEGAAILGIKEKAYESLLSRARKSLQSTLTPSLLGIIE